MLYITDMKHFICDGMYHVLDSVHMALSFQHEICKFQVSAIFKIADIHAIFMFGIICASSLSFLWPYIYILKIWMYVAVNVSRFSSC